MTARPSANLSKVRIRGANLHVWHRIETFGKFAGGRQQRRKIWQPAFEVQICTPAFKDLEQTIRYARSPWTPSAINELSQFFCTASQRWHAGWCGAANRCCTSTENWSRPRGCCRDANNVDNLVPARLVLHDGVQILDIIAWLDWLGNWPGMADGGESGSVGAPWVINDVSIHALIDQEAKLFHGHDHQNTGDTTRT